MVGDNGFTLAINDVTQRLWHDGEEVIDTGRTVPDWKGSLLFIFRRPHQAGLKLLSRADLDRVEAI